MKTDRLTFYLDGKPLAKRVADLHNGKIVEKLAEYEDAEEPDRYWIEVRNDNEDLFFQRRFVCPYCGDSNTYGKTTHCPYCGRKIKRSCER